MSLSKSLQGTPYFSSTSIFTLYPIIITPGSFSAYTYYHFLPLSWQMTSPQKVLDRYLLHE